MTDTPSKPFERGYGPSTPDGADLSESELTRLVELRDDMLYGAPGSTPVSLAPIETGMEDIVGRTQKSSKAVLGATVSSAQPLEDFCSEYTTKASPTTGTQISDQSND